MLKIPIPIDFAAEAEALRGCEPNYSHFDFPIHEEAWVSTPQGVLAHFLPNAGVLSTKAIQMAEPIMASVKTIIKNRGDAVGKGSMMERLLLTKQLSRTREVPPEVSALIGYSDQLGFLDPSKGGEKRSTDYCRPTGWTRNHWEDYFACLPAIKEIDLAFKEQLPDKYAEQREIVRQADRYHIEGTAFSTLNCNRNWQTWYHRDKHDLRNGWIALFALGKFTGGELVIPRYRVAFYMGPGDVLFFDPHQSTATYRSPVRG
jgi:Oxygenase domain of the 2OGFeDO superfamily